MATGVAVMQAHGGDTRADVDIAASAVAMLAGIPKRFQVRSLSARPHASRTIALTLGCEMSSHWVLQLDAGVPPKIRVNGSGVLAPPGITNGLLRLDLDQYPTGTLVEQRLWNPILAVRYRFADDGALIRPFISAGATFVWFTDETVRPAFARAVDQQFGQPLALAQGRPGRTHTSLSVSSLWAPALAFGAEWNLTARWAIRASMGYSPMHVQARLRTTAADGTWLTTARTRTDLDASNFQLVATYRFDDR